MTILTFDRLNQIMPSAGSRAAVYLTPLNAAMEAAFINTPKRVTMFVAEVAHESEEFLYSAEIWGPAQVPVQAGYWQRADLGNTRPEAIAMAARHGMVGVALGKFFRGYGPIQVTGYDNQIKATRYFMAKGVGPASEDDMVPWLQSPDGGCKASAFFWMTHGLNEIADADNYDNLADEFDKVSDIVNFGHPTPRLGDTNGWLKRLSYYERAKKVLMFADVEGGVA